MKKGLPSWAYKVAIVVATIIWGYSFVSMKDVVAVIPPAWLLGFRFLFAGIVLTAILWKRVRKAFSGKMVLAGTALGLADYLAFWTQTVGLEHTTPGINAFLTATYCVIVPFLWWIIAHRRPTVFNIGAAVLALVGIWLVSVQSGGMTMGFGEVMTLVCAVMFAVHMVLVSKFSRFHDVLALTAVQFVAEGCMGLLSGAAFETFPGFAAFTPGIISQLLFLSIFASIVAFGIQNVSLDVYKRQLLNNMAKASEQLNPGIRTVREWLQEQPGVCKAMMSGSGAAVFAVCDSFASAAKVATDAQAKGWWARTTTFGPFKATLTTNC